MNQMKRNPKMKRLSIATLLLISIAMPMLAMGQDLTVRKMMAEPSMTGMRAESQRLAPDGEFVYFTWNPEGKNPRDLYRVPRIGGVPQKLVDAANNHEDRSSESESKLDYGLIVRDDFVKDREKNISGIDISPDSSKLLFSQNSDIYILDLAVPNPTPRRVTKTQGPEIAPRWLTNDKVLFSQGGNAFVLELSPTKIVQLTREANAATFQSVSSVTPSLDSSKIAYVVTDGSRQRTLYVPNYLPEFTQIPSIRRGWTTQKLFVAPTDGEKTFEVKLPSPEGNGYIRGLDWNADGSAVIVDRLDKDLKRRQILFVSNPGQSGQSVAIVTDETDEKWIAPLSRFVEPHPTKPGEILFTSERDGFNHIYTATREGDSFTTKQITKGDWEIDWVKYANKGESIVYNSTFGNTAERQFFEYIVERGKANAIAPRELGMKTAPQLEEGGGKPVLLYEFSTWRAPSELRTIEVCTACSGIAEPRQHTNTTPAEFLSMKWSEPKFIDVPSRDGKRIKTKVYLPANFDKKKKYPMVMFIHGAGYLQNTINGWNNYYREFLFNQMLTQKGYIVFDIDFRGSAGYGRDWRTDVHDFLGGKDFEDHIDAIEYGVANYSVDKKRVGVYGGSYGGFMAGMLAMRAPDHVAASAALRPVFDWKNYYAANPTYTAERLGIPERNPEAYKRSSPIAYADQLRSPLLILHGLADDNVHAQDSIQLIEKLIRLGKTDYFEAMVYPSENHGFVRPESWADEYERIFVFFEKYLKR
jgi:dipeptidyl aminopeptidase/acylaminoacyl peptidase